MNPPIQLQPLCMKINMIKKIPTSADDRLQKANFGDKPAAKILQSVKQMADTAHRRVDHGKPRTVVWTVMAAVTPTADLGIEAD